MRRGESLALEQTTELPAGAPLDEMVARRVVGRVENVAPCADGSFRIDVLYPSGTQDGSVAQLLNVLFGNSSLQPDVVLLDAELPDWLTKSFRGPRFGLPGLRELTGVHLRTLTCTALKPQGLATRDLAQLCQTFARAGIDIVKDDHGVADQASAPFEARVRACQSAVVSVLEETGHRALYVPNVLGTPSAMRRQLELARQAGVRAVMIQPMVMGLPAFEELIREDPGVAIFAHPSLAGASRIAPPFLLGRLFRLLGADAVIFPHAGGRFAAFDAEVCGQIADRLRDESCGLRVAAPVPAGGMRFDNVAALVEFYGLDSVLLVGGSLYLAGAALQDRARQFVRAVNAACGGPQRTA